MFSAAVLYPANPPKLNPLGVTVVLVMPYSCFTSLTIFIVIVPRSAFQSTIVIINTESEPFSNMHFSIPGSPVP